MSNTNRIINIRLTVQNYHFDAAIDCNYTLHCYEETEEEKLHKVPIELYNLDKPDWDIKVVYCTADDIKKYDNTFNSKLINGPNSLFAHTFISYEFIYNAVVDWIKENS